MRKLSENKDEEPLIRNMKIRVLSRQHVLAVGASQKLAHLQKARCRRDTHHSVGDIVFYWRNVRPGMKSKNVGRPGARGFWMGPAIVIATPKTVDGSGGPNICLEAPGPRVPESGPPCTSRGGRRLLHTHRVQARSPCSPLTRLGSAPKAKSSEMNAAQLMSMMKMSMSSTHPR